MRDFLKEEKQVEDLMTIKIQLKRDYKFLINKPDLLPISLISQDFR
jgi:hypothetical protein